jgi:hypothetical protein
MVRAEIDRLEDQMKKEMRTRPDRLVDRRSKLVRSLNNRLLTLPDGPGASWLMRLRESVMSKVHDTDRLIVAREAAEADPNAEEAAWTIAQEIAKKLG